MGNLEKMKIKTFQDATHLARKMEWYLNSDICGYWRTKIECLELQVKYGDCTWPDNGQGDLCDMDATKLNTWMHYNGISTKRAEKKYITKVKELYKRFKKNASSEDWEYFDKN